MTERTCSVEGCERRLRANGYCNLHYERVRRGKPVGGIEPRSVPAPPEERFWRFVDKRPDGCWIWTGHINDTGYGSFGPGGGRTMSSHRFAYRMLVGEIPDGFHHLDHLCRNRACCNPAHLEPVTASENVRRGIDHRGCINGHPWTPENTYVRKDRGHRQCRQCQRERARAAYARKVANR